MIIFHCFAELPARDQKSRDGWVNRANYDTEEVLAQAARGERNFSTDCRRVLQSLSGLKYDPKMGSDHRAALEDFAAAIDTLLLKNPPTNLKK